MVLDTELKVALALVPKAVMHTPPSVAWMLALRLATSLQPRKG